MNFLDQLKNLSSQVKFKADFGDLSPFKNIVVSGMGGSGIAGAIFSEIYDKVPVQVVSDYSLPKYANMETLFIGISYSGNTEETVQVTDEAIKKGCQVKMITSGGKMSELDGDLVKIPGGLQPRSAIGYLLKPFLSSFIESNEDAYLRVSELLSEIDRDNSNEEKLAREIIESKQIPIIYGHYPYRWIAYRWKTQFNENSKLLAYSAYFPELNHNETVPLKETYNKETFRFLAFGDTSPRIAERKAITSEITKTKFTEIEVRGETLLEKMFYLIHFGDYLSYHAALKRNIDPEDVSVITELKNRLEKL